MIANRRTAGALVMGLLCFASADARAQVSKVRTNDGAVLTTAAPKVEESLPSGASLIYSNFGTGTSLYNAGSGWTEAGAEANDYPLAEAMAFTPTGNYIVLRIKVAVTYLSGTNGMNLVLAEDNGGVPGNTIYTASFTNLPEFGTCCTVETAKLAPTKSSYVLLKAGKQYWLYPLPADTTSYLIWNLDTTKKMGNGAVSKDNATTWTPTTLNPFGAFSLYGYAVTQ